MNNTYYEKKCKLYGRFIMDIWNLNNDGGYLVLNKLRIDRVFTDLDNKLELLDKEYKNDED